MMEDAIDIYDRHHS